MKIFFLNFLFNMCFYFYINNFYHVSACIKLSGPTLSIDFVFYLWPDVLSHSTLQDFEKFYF